MTSSQLTPASVRELTPPSRYGRAWTERLRALPARRAEHALDVEAGDTVLVVTAHPDDETFGLGGTIGSLTDAGVRVDLLCATSGEAAYDAAGLHAPDLAERRRAELATAAEALQITEVEVLALRDGHLAAHQEALTAIIGRHLAARDDVTHVVALWDRDPHPDHAAVGRAARNAARRHHRRVSGFPVWAFHWSDPQELLPEGAAATVVDVGPVAGARRRRAVRGYPSQTAPLSEEIGPVVPPGVVDWTTEMLVPL